MGTTEAPQRPAGVSGWSRGRGIAAAVVAIFVVALTLILSRIDLANELNVVRSELAAANQEVEESGVEIDELEDEVAACRDSAELGEEVRRTLQAIQRDFDRGQVEEAARRMARLELESDWAEANQRCLEGASAEE